MAPVAERRAAPLPPANRRAFGSPAPASKPSAPSLPLTSASASASTIASVSASTSTSTHTPTPRSTSASIPAPAPRIGRERSQSSASGSGSAPGSAAERASQWLAALAPRGEGRSREFITSTLSGVATVASTVGQEVNGFIKAGGGSVGASSVGSPPESRPRSAGRPTPGASSIAGGAEGTNGRPIPRPANMSRLVGTASPVASPPGHAFVRSSTLPAPVATPAASASASASTSATVPQSASPVPPRSSATPPPRADSAPGSSGHAGHTRRGSAQLGGGGRIVPPGHGHVRSSSLGAIAVSSARVRGAGMPYKIGFQPSGVRADRTAEYLLERQVRAADRDKEEGRLGRRWAKLVDLHFNPATQTRPPAAVPTTAGRKSGGFMDLDSLNPKEVWKGLKMGPNPDEARKRAAEQTIVKWESDGEVRRCRVCDAGFTLSTRKHHCRLCGRIVCSLPPTPPALLAVQTQLFGNDDGKLPPGTRSEKCSLLLVADYRTGRGEEVDEGFVGWMSLDGPGGPGVRRRTHTRASSASSSMSGSTPLPQQPQEVQVKGVRVCRDCWAVVRRKQTMADRARAAPVQRLYAALRVLQSEIEGQLSDFDDEFAAARARVAQVDTDTADAADLDISDLVTAHKALLALLGQYDVLAKRLAALPADGAQAQALQATLARTAATFLARAMAQVHEVPKLERAIAAAKAKHLVVVQSRLPDVLRAEGVGTDKADDIARQLQPLLEQQAQLESFIAEANAQRKYDDSRSLAAALSDIEAEIGRLTASALE